MRHTNCILLLFFITIATKIHASESMGGNSTVASCDLRIISLEQQWTTTHSAFYFGQARSLFREIEGATRDKNVDFFISQLDLASGVLLKSRCGSEFGPNESGPVRFNQAEIVKRLAATDVRQLKSLTAWPEFRGRYARLLMYQRATWICYRDSSLDDMKIVQDSTVRMQPDPDAQKRELLNKKIRMQIDLKRIMKESWPTIDRFMVNAFSIEPADFRMLNEMLAMGLYTPEERAKLVTEVAQKIPQLPDILKIQLPPATEFQKSSDSVISK